MLRPAIGFAVLLGFATGSPAQEATKPVGENELREAASRAIHAMKKSQGAWYEKATCTSCHHHMIPEITYSFARGRGIDVDLAAASEFTTKSFSYLKDLDALIQGFDYIDEIDDAFRLVAADAAGIKPNLSTDAVAQFITSMQRPDGSWYTMDARPPQSHSRFTITAICVRAVALYMPKQFDEEKRAVLMRARDWFLKAEPRTTEDLVFQLLGLAWTGADEPTRQKAARALQSQQRNDGGWTQLPRLDSDSYATGTALYALHAAGVLTAGDKEYQNGLRFLLKTQKDDGSWRVETRMFPPGRGSPQYFDAKFPNGRYHQFVSIMGTGWAAMALMQELPTTPQPAQLKLPDLSPPEEKTEWVRVALNGTAADLQKALDAGMQANAKTAKGTTALMLASRDPAKVKLLIDRGADVNVRAESGITALIVASRYRGNAEVLSVLLEEGATVNTPRRFKVKNDASAIFFSATTGDREMVRILLAARADLESRMHVLGQFHFSPFLAAVARGDTKMVEYLVGRGVDVNQLDKDRSAAIDAAVTNNHVETAKLLLAKGAKINRADRYSLTPLMYAASVDFGDTEMVELLMKAGADKNAQDDEGRTALDLAKLYKHSAIERLLAGK